MRSSRRYEGLNVKNFLINSAKHLYKQEGNISPLQYNAERVIETIYLIKEDSNVHLSQEDKHIAVNLIIEVVRELDNCVFHLGNSFVHHRWPCNLMLHSGVQFLLDDLKCWPIDCNTPLKNHCIIFVKGNSVETFDNALKQWK